MTEASRSPLALRALAVVSLASFVGGCHGGTDRDSSAKGTTSSPASDIPRAAGSAISQPASTSGNGTSASSTPIDKPSPWTELREALPEPDLYATTQPEQRAAMLRRMKVMHRLSDAQLAGLEKVIEGSHILGQGNPELAKYAMTRQQCIEAREAAHVIDREHAICGGPYMMPLFDPTAGQTDADATACIDSYEFPDMPCDYPVTWASPREGALLCEAMGKRLCDAHEWEGACAGAVHDPSVEYAWGNSRKTMKDKHNAEREIIWAYGPEADMSLCGTHSRKSKSCEDSGYKRCGSNTYPSGSFPKCVSKLGVFDLHGNVAEHMNLPLAPEQLESRGGTGETEMKGSWFMFGTQKEPPHEDDCRWRAPDWHVTKVMSGKGHANYHLGFRCCKSVGPSNTGPSEKKTGD